MVLVFVRVLALAPALASVLALGFASVSVIALALAEECASWALGLLARRLEDSVHAEVEDARWCMA